MTERLFEKDPYIREFDARVVECIEDGDKYLVQLDRTAFFLKVVDSRGTEGILGRPLFLIPMKKKAVSGIKRIRL
ncbi:MAG: hypothetical protein EOM34_04130 [Clostridia bacterium]|nr:hypothetical protein [Clostridia bacterium]NCD02794.1 hypothetical protein [Clostridia bacterium]